MYLHTRLLLGIGMVTLVALVISVIVPLESVRGDVARETDASMQLAQLLLDVQRAVDASKGSTAARAAATQEIRRAPDIRHVRVSLVDEHGALLATTPADDPTASRITHLLLSSSEGSTLSYPVAYQATPLGALRVSSNPMSELGEIEQRVGRDLLLLALTILAMGAAIYSMVRRGLRPIAQVQSALAALQAGAFQTRLPRFRLRDVDDIAARFNQCAAAMEESAAQRRDLHRRVIEAEEQERKRLARELHDELGQSLTAIKVDAAYIVREAHGTSAKIISSARSIERLSSEIMELIRSMLARLRPHGLETVGLRESVQDLVNGWQARVADRFQCSLAFEGDVDSLAPELNITVYRLIQECLTNAVRHSRARAISLRLSMSDSFPNRISVDVTESGTSLPDIVDPSGSLGAAIVGTGAGLMGMRERVEAHGGELRVDVGRGGGLSLHAWMPTALEQSGLTDPR